MWQVTDETDRVCEDDRYITLEIDTTKCRIERGEQLVLYIDVIFRQHIEQAGFSGICIAHQ